MTAPAISQSRSTSRQDVIIPAKNVDEVIYYLERRKVLEEEVVNLKEQKKNLEGQIRSLDLQINSLQGQLILFRQSEYAWQKEKESYQIQLAETQKRLKRLRRQKAALIATATTGAVAYIAFRFFL